MRGAFLFFTNATIIYIKTPLLYSSRVSTQSEKEKEVSKILTECRLELLKKTNDPELIVEFENCYNAIIDIECENSFKEGFSMATKLIYEALT